MSIERRKFERIAVHEAVLVELVPGDARLATLTDISLGGAFVERASVDVGTRLTLHLRCGDAEWSAAVRAVVRWTSTRGFGVEFLELDARGSSAVASAVVRAQRPSHARQRVATVGKIRKG